MVEIEQGYRDRGGTEISRPEISGDKFGRLFLISLNGEMARDGVKGVDIAAAIGHVNVLDLFLEEKGMDINAEYTKNEAMDFIVQLIFSYDAKKIKRETWDKREVSKLLYNRFQVKSEEINKLYEVAGHDWEKAGEIGLVGVSAILGLFYIERGREEGEKEKRIKAYMALREERSAKPMEKKQKDLEGHNPSPWRDRKLVVDAQSTGDNGTENKEACVHHWMIDPAQGSFSQGRCKNCGKVGEFRNSTTWGVGSDDKRVRVPRLSGSKTFYDEENQQD